jgi:hypothetical protein
MCVECDVFYQYVKYNMKYQYLAAQKNWQNMTSVVRVQKFKLQIMAHKSRIFSPTLFSGFWSVIFIPRVCQYTMLGHLQVTFPNGSRLSKHAHATGVTAQRGDPNGSSIPHTWATSQRCDTNGSSYMSHGPAVRRLQQWYQFSWRWQTAYMSTTREATATVQGIVNSSKDYFHPIDALCPEHIFRRCFQYQGSCSWQFLMPWETMIRIQERCHQ